MPDQDLALLSLGERLRALGYRFVTITPESHSRVNARPSSAEAGSLRDVFGWSRPFRAAVLGKELFDLLVRADALRGDKDRFTSLVRFSSLGEQLFVHSAYPTHAADSVFFGPDTYRFVSWLRRVVPSDAGRIVDVGAGSGAGGISIASRATRLLLGDINPAALRYSAINAALNKIRDVQIAESDVLRGVTGDVDVVISNPPYMADARARTYRHGGDRGIALSLRIVEESLDRLGAGGKLFVYTGTPIVDGEDLFHRALASRLSKVRGSVHYEELDPDVFGEELSTGGYADTDRLAVVGLSISLG